MLADAREQTSVNIGDGATVESGQYFITRPGVTVRGQPTPTCKDFTTTPKSPEAQLQVLGENVVVDTVEFSEIVKLQIPLRRK